MTINKNLSFLLPAVGGGGAEKMVLNIAEELRSRGYNIDVVLFSKEGEYLERISQESNVIVLNGKNLVGKVLGLQDYLQNRCPDVLMATLTLPNVLAIWAKVISGVNTRIVNRIANINSLKHPTSIKSHAVPYLRRISYRYSDQLVAISNGVKNDIVESYGVPPNKICTIYNPAFSEKIIESRSSATQSLEHIDPDRPTILGVGRLERQKNFSYLVDAFNAVKEKINAQLLILGEGKKRAELEEKISSLSLSSHVQMPGFIEDPYPYMYQSDVFVLPSIFEGFGNVIVEALACQCPVIVTNCPGGPTEIIQDGRHGLVAELNNVNDLSSKIEGILTQEVTFAPTQLESRARDFNQTEIVTNYIEKAF